MKKRKISAPYGLAGLLLGISILQGDLFAEEEERLFDAKIGIRAEYNDNLFLTPADKTNDFLFSLTPEVGLNVITQPAEIKLKYLPRFVIPVLNITDSRLRRILHAGELTVASELANGIKLLLRDRLVASPQNLGTPEDQDSALIQTNRVTLDGIHTMELGGRTDFETNLRVGRFDAGGEGAARSDFLGSLRVVRDLNSIISVGLRGGVDYQLFDDSSIANLMRYRVVLEPRIEITPRLSLYAPNGVEWLSFDGGGTSWDITSDVELTYELSERSKVMLAYQQSFEADPTGSSFRVQQVTLSSDLQFTSRIRFDFSTGYRRFREQTSDPVTGASGQATDSLLSIRPALWYTFSDRLKFQVGYSLSLNRGDIGTNDFNNHLVFLGVQYSLWGISG